MAKPRPPPRFQQISIQHYFPVAAAPVAVARSSSTSHPLAVSVAPAGDSAIQAENPAYRHFLPGAGASAPLAIDVELWADQAPIDVDAEDDPDEGDAGDAPDAGAAQDGEGAAADDSAPLFETVDRASVSHDTPSISPPSTPARIEDDTQFTCPICFDTYRHPVVTLCVHIFCEDCIQANYGYSGTCPLCRATLTEPPQPDRIFEIALELAIERGEVKAPTGPTWASMYE
ncbi:hypothetical protein DFH06DRAFT_1151635 [Mycena polygramma]|nr:hypothetical protein DFH06DRAFT_1151635 [Mycena polygramma]